jgi:putative membrane protein
MNRKTSTLMSLGISMALIAAGIWFLYDGHYRFGFRDSGWIMPHHSMMGGGGMGIIMIIFWVVVIAAIALAVSSVISNRRPPHGREDDISSSSNALEILNQRYARGEIDRHQYEAIRRDLEENAS